MTKDKQRIAIAEFCGWKDLIHRKDNLILGTRPDGLKHAGVPNYPEDLNASHEAEKLFLREYQHNTTIQKIMWEKYVRNLIRISEGLELNRFVGSIVFIAVHATASQRAEALLLTIGKWEESQ